MLNPKQRQLLLDRPISLMDTKLRLILELCADRSRVLEVGAFAGGTAYLLARQCPWLTVTTCDTNDFANYLDQHPHITQWVREQHDLELTSDIMWELQALYQSQQPNLTVLAPWQPSILRPLPLEGEDLVILDGDHRTHILARELTQCYLELSPDSMVVVDDCRHSHIRAIAQRAAELFQWQTVDLTDDLAVLKTAKRRDFFSCEAAAAR